MKQEKQRKTNGMTGLLTRLNNGFERLEKKWRNKGVRRGIRHEKGQYCGVIDFIRDRQVEYGIDDIVKGKAERPESNYMTGKYMEIGNRLLKSGVKYGDSEAAMTGSRIFEWLGQGNRQSVSNKVRLAYRKAKQVAKEHEVPISVDDDRRYAIVPSDLKRELDNFLERNPGYKLSGLVGK
jgi:hypothetical protein